jgi:hypothetical protein
VRAKRIRLPYRTAGGGRGERVVTAYFTHHGPVVRAEGDRWVSVRLMQEPVRALQQSYLRTKARSYAEFARVMALRTNSSNNTVYADADGTIAYWHGNFVPRRDTTVDWSKPVDGSDPRTEWRGLHEVAETITLKDPANGWIQNTNNWPFSAAGPNSPRRERYPKYMWELPENPRGVHAVRVLTGRRGFTLDSLIRVAYDPDLPAFDALVPALARDFDALPAGDTLRAALGEQVALLRAWDRRWSAASVPTSLAVYWGEALMARTADSARAAGADVYAYMASDAARAARLPAPGGRVGAHRPRLRHVAHAVGRDQPLPAPRERPRRAAQRLGAEPAGAVHVGRVGVAGVDRRAGGGAPDAAALRQLRQQLRRRGGVRAARAGAQRARRRRERRPALAALRRPGGDVQPRRVQGGAVLPGGRRAPPGARLPPRRPGRGALGTRAGGGGRGRRWRRRPGARTFRPTRVDSPRP